MNLFGELSALLTSLLWSGSSIAFASASERIGSLQLNLNRMALASVFLIVTIFIMGFDFNLSQTQSLNLIISGLIGLVIGDSFLFKSYQLVGARISMLLMALSPGMSTILAYLFLEERITMLGIIGIFITIAGIILVVLERNSNSKYNIKGIGLLYGTLAALGQSVGLIYAKLAFEEGHINGLTATFIRVFSSVIIFLPVLVMLKKFKNPFRLYASDKPALRATIMGTILGPFLGITFSLIAVENTKVGIAATLMSTTPILMLPMVKYISKEKLTWRAITGAVIAVIGVALIFLR